MCIRPIICGKEWHIEAPTGQCCSLIALVNAMVFNQAEGELDSMNVIEFCMGQTQWWDVAA